jgi:beta-lactamase regulating signal transducer with metallopeptidase domain
MDFYDLAPATLLALIITAAWIFGFTLGAAGVVLTRIVLPARRRHRLSLEERELRNIVTVFQSLPAPKHPIPSTVRKVTKW